MQEMIVARRYALGIALEAQSTNVMVPVADALTFFAKQVSARGIFFDLIDNPVFNQDERVAAINRICERGAYEKLVCHALCSLVRKKRMRLLPMIAVSYTKIVDEMLGQARVVVTSALPMDPRAHTSIFQALEKMLGKKVVGEFERDRSVLGGVKAEVDGLVLDGTVKGRLETLEQYMNS